MTQAQASPVIVLPQYQNAITIIQNRINSGNNEYSTAPGRFVGDTLVVPQALSDVNQGIQTWYLNQKLSLTQLLTLESDQNNLNLLATAFNTTVSQMLVEISLAIQTVGARFGLSENPAQAATGIAYFGVADAPTSNITVGQGVVVTSIDGQQFQTTTSATLIAANAASYYSTQLQQYVLPVPVVALVPGSAGNIPNGTLSTLSTPVSGISYVTNLADFEGGEPVETDAQFVARVLNSWAALGRVTDAGIEQAVQATFPAAGGVYVAGQGDPLNLRGLGTADAFVQNRIPATVTETFSGYNHPTIPNAILPTQAPVMTLTSVSSGTAFVQSDTTSVLQGSSVAADAIRFSAAPSFPLTITYEINAVPGLCQALYSAADPTGITPLNYQQPTRGIPGLETPLLFHQAPQLPIDYSIAIQVQTGFQASSVIAAVQAAVSAYLTGFDLGAQEEGGLVYVADVDNVAQGVAGVLRLAGDPVKFSPTGQAGVDNSISVLMNQAIIAGNILITAA